MKMESLNLIYLKYFIDAAESKNVSEAARKNFVTQSCVSQGIKKLEQTLKIDLTQHLRNRFKLTEEGEIVFAKGKQVFNSLKAILEEVSQHNQVIKGEVVLATTPSLALTFYPKIFSNVAEKYPHIQLKIRIGRVDQIQQWIKKEEVDFAIVLDQPEFNRYERQELEQGNFHLYKHKSLKKWDKIYADSLSGMAVSNLQGEILELESWELVAEFIDSKLGVGVLPSFMVNRYPKFVSIEEINFNYKICGIYSKGTKLTLAAYSVINLGLQE